MDMTTAHDTDFSLFEYKLTAPSNSLLQTRSPMVSFENGQIRSFSNPEKALQWNRNSGFSNNIFLKKASGEGPVTRGNRPSRRFREVIEFSDFVDNENVFIKLDLNETNIVEQVRLLHDSEFKIDWNNEFVVARLVYLLVDRLGISINGKQLIEPTLLSNFLVRE